MKFSSQMLSNQLLVIFMLGFIHLVWTRPSVEEAVSSATKVPQSVRQEKGLEAVVLTTAPKSESKSVDTGDATEMTREVQSTRKGQQPQHENSNNPVHSSDVRKDSHAADGAGSVVQPTNQEGRWARLKSYFRDLISKLLSLFGKKTKVNPTEAPEALAQLLQENKLKEYLRRRHGLKKSSEAAVVDELQLHGQPRELSPDDLWDKPDKLLHERLERERRWSKAPSGPLVTNLRHSKWLTDSQKKEQAIQLEIAAIREEASLIGSLLTGNFAEANQRLQIVEALHALAERYRAAIKNPAMATIRLEELPPYSAIVTEWLDMRPNFHTAYEEQRNRRIREALTKANSKAEV